MTADNISVTRNSSSVGQLPGQTPMQRFTTLWREGGASKVVQRSHQYALRNLHEKVLDPFLGAREVCPTGVPESITDMRIDSEFKTEAAYYCPTPRLVIRWVSETFDAPEQWSFVDIGTGKGRVILEAARYPFANAMGIEFAEELYEGARRNVEALPASQTKAGRVEAVLGDATKWLPPEGPVAFFLYNPFGAEVLEKFLDNVLQSEAHSGHPTQFYYLNPEEAHVFERDQRLKETALPGKLARRVNMLSPYQLRLFEKA